jgi:LytS/YehU family sensor histidine kinase
MTGMHGPTLSLVNFGALETELGGFLTVLGLILVGAAILAAVSGNMRRVAVIIGGVLGAGVVAVLIGIIVNPKRVQAVFGKFFT